MRALTLAFVLVMAGACSTARFTGDPSFVSAGERKLPSVRPQVSEPTALLARVSDRSPADATDKNRDQPDKSYVLPAFEIVGFEVLLNVFNRNFSGDKEDYRSDLHTMVRNLKGGWQFDRDSFNVNQVGHPYQGSVYYTISRSAGLNFWESFGYTAGGSLLWEIAGERTHPSVNDQITTSFGGTFLGESLYRTAETFFRTEERTGSPAAALGGAIASPAADVNRLALARRETPDLDRKRPDFVRELQLGYARNTEIVNQLDSRHVNRNLAEARFTIEYGLPGKRGYDYSRPFDYYDLDLGLTTSGNDNVDHLLVNGLLYGKRYSAGELLRGVYGLYGNYNYIAPETFRVASSAVSFGTTTRWQPVKRVTVLDTLLAGVGFGAGGSIHETEAGRSYHYGAVPQELLELRTVIDDRASLSLVGEHFLVTGSSSDEGGSGIENITRLALGLTVRVWGPHALGIEWDQSRRLAPFDDIPDQNQRVETARLLYTYVFGESLGGTSW